MRTAELTLDTADLAAVGSNAMIWEKVVRKLKARAMPPAGSPRPDADVLAGLVSWLETSLDAAAASRPNPGRPTLHRLNRVEYANAIRDLLGLEIDVRSLLPADTTSYGFDNIADALSLSPGLLERYLSAAQKIAQLAVGLPPRRNVESVKVPRLLEQDQRMADELSFGTRGGMALRHYFPVDGEYVIRLRLQGAARGGPPTDVDVRLDGVAVSRFQVGGPPRPDAQDGQRSGGNTPEFRLTVAAGPRLIGVSFGRRQVVAEGSAPARMPVASNSRNSVETVQPTLESVEIDGPYKSFGAGNTLSRRLIFACHPERIQDEEPCARRIFATLARRAYRRPVTSQDVDRLMQLLRELRKTEGFEASVARGLEGVLVSPEFLFRVERDPSTGQKGDAYRLSDLELASRLSFFLWSSIPDEELLGLAERRELQKAAVLEQQIRRMLADPRAAAMIINFGGQWLQTRNMRLALPDVKEFPDFDENLRDALQRETELFLVAQLREDRSAVDLLTARYTFLNERLAKHYGVPGVYGGHFRRVDLSDDRRVGLLGHGSILTVTSHPNRTSPVVRGKWLLETLLGTPPPPPPPNVPALRDVGEGGRPASVRERMQQHRANPVCASCHKVMDPLGFALENFDALGKWRVSDAGAPIDATGTLPDGTPFDGPTQLRAALLRTPEQFVTTVTEQLLTYAMGRGVEYYDAPAVRQIVRNAARHDFRWSSLVLGIVKSTPFQMRRRES